MASDVHAAIAEYERRIADGEIVFGDSGFAEIYPGKQAQEEALAAFVRSHAPTGL
jgi:hypothetical protein